jgi:hypothetical protein
MTAPVTVDNRRPVTESAERFLRAIVAEVPVERLAELHLFTTLRQGVYESGVAVVAAWPLGTPRPAPTDQPTTDTPPADDPSVESSEPVAPTARHTIYTARYRLVVKGPDRGRWEFECVAEADAPLITAENVVRGVQRRSGDLDAPTRYDADDLRHVLRLVTPSATPAPDAPTPDAGTPDAGTPAA